MKKIFSNIFKKWYVFIVGLVITITAFISISSIFANPKAYERFNFYCSSISLKQNLLISKLNEVKNEKIYEINCQFAISSDFSNSYTIYNAVFEYQDICILPANHIVESTKDFYLSRTLPFEEEKIKLIFNKQDFDFMYYNNKACGIKIYDASTKKGYLTDFIEYESDKFTSDYYLFFSPLSMTIGELNNSPNSFGLDIIKAMFSL